MTTKFEEKFQNGLSGGWIGKNGGAHNAVIVADPLGSNDKVLTFTQTNTCLDIASPTIAINPNQNYILSFDYLGKPLDNNIVKNLGCVIGIGSLQLTDFTLAAAVRHDLSNGANNLGYVVLVDDSKWHHYSIMFSYNTNEIRIDMEDWSFDGQNTRAGDCYFKNILLTDGNDEQNINLVNNPGAEVGSMQGWTTSGGWVRLALKHQYHIAELFLF